MKETFLDLLLASGALQFGSFKTKSGRLSPYFINTGSFDNGALLSQIAGCYADLIQRVLPGGPWHLFGPAYKGIALATSIAQELSRRTGQEVPYTFNRKEAKDHGEGGSFIGRCLTANSSLVITEDVMTGGTSVRDCLEFLKPIGAQVKDVVVGVDRQERGRDQRLASAEISQDYHIRVHAILCLEEIVQILWNKPRLGKVWIDDDIKKRIDLYRAEWAS